MDFFSFRLNFGDMARIMNILAVYMHRTGDYWYLTCQRKISINVLIHYIALYILHNTAYLK